METEKWLVPGYYKDFKCKCGACRHTCCHGWKIPISKQEYLNLIEMECNDEMYRKIQMAFVDPECASEERYKIISFNYLGDCPIQENGLCKIHAEFGETKLPKVCRLYPRSLKQINHQKVACCSSSCERVVELLLDSENLDLSYHDLFASVQMEVEVGEDVINELINFSNIMKDCSKPLAQRIREICLEVDKKEFIKDFNYDVNPIKEGLELLNRLTDENSFLATILQSINSRYQDDFYQYELDKEKFEKDYPKWETYFENVINNSIIFESFPFVDERFDKTKAYKGLCASYGLLRIVCIGYHATNTTKEDLVDAIASLFHLIDHTAFYYNVNILAPAAALLLKL